MKTKYTAVILLLCTLISGCGFLGFDDEDPPAVKTESAAEPAESDWNLKVDQTIKSDPFGEPFAFTLKIDATKEFGTDPLGTYNGTIYYKVEHILPDPLTGYNIEEFPEQAITFVLVPYDDKAFAAYGQNKTEGEPAPLAPLEEPIGMCLQNEMLNGEWKMDIDWHDGDGPRQAQKPATLNMKLKMMNTGNTVMIDVIEPNLTIPGFTGDITSSSI